MLNETNYTDISSTGQFRSTRSKKASLFDFSRLDFWGLESEELGVLFLLLLHEAKSGKNIEVDDQTFSRFCRFQSVRKWKRISSKLKREGFISFDKPGPGRRKLYFEFASPFLIVKLLKMFDRQEIPHEIRKAVYERDRYACVECGADTHLTCDHIIAVTSGGETILENLRTLCLPCNASKGAKNGAMSW